ncbi:MAG TPA: tyrosine-type recombinase/integrase [Ignavibacteriaceae bacterium]|nr:tyrosine-type recombinase/integrase [Ignavibacteriaceae bacterium]
MAAVRAKDNKLFIDYRVNGERRREFLKLADTRENRKIAEIRRKEIEFENATGLLSERIRRSNKKGMTLNKGLAEFLEGKSEIRPSTHANYRQAMEKLIKYTGDISINKITPELVKEVREKLKTDKYKPNITRKSIAKENQNQETKEIKLKVIKENTAISYFHKLRIIFNYFVKQKYIEVNPIPSQKLKLNRIVTIPDKDLIDILSKLKLQNREHYKVVMFLLLTGLRVGEIIGLSFEKNIDFREEILRVWNFKKDREDLLPLYPELSEFIRSEWNVYSGLLFNYKSAHSLKFYDRFRQREGYDKYSFHTLRKTFITKLINSGMSVYDVMTLARHKNIETTLRHYSLADLRRMGNEISSRTNMGTILGTEFKKGLKLVENA